MKLMFIVPRANGGGAEKVITSLSSRFAGEHEVYLVTTVKPNSLENYPMSDTVHPINLYERMTMASAAGAAPASGGRLAGLLRRIRNRLLRFAQNHAAGFQWFFRWQNDRRQIRALRDLKQELGIDCAVSFLNSANYLNAMSRAGERTVISIRSYLNGPFSPDESRTARGRRHIKAACRKADCVVAVSQEAEHDLIKSYGAPRRRVRAIYNICDAEKIRADSALPAEDAALLEKLEKASTVICSTGRLTEKKGHWHLVRAFREIVREDPGAVLLILGREGSVRENTAGLLREIIRADGLEENVLLPGFYPNPFPYLARGDVYVCASFNEGFPNALIEAMALGLPAISTDCRSGPREILAPATDCESKTAVPELAEFGVLLPECSGRKLPPDAPPEPEEQYMADAIKQLLRDKDLRAHYREQSLARAGEFTAEKIMKQWHDVILGNA